jgi:soluble lytic murein transglycosylase
MLFRVIVAFLLFLSTVVRVSATSLYPIDDSSLQESVEQIRLKNYAEAREFALKAKATPVRNFILGVSNHRLENWDEAADLLAKSPEKFPLLADYALFYRADSLFHLGRYDEAIESLQALKKHYPESPLSRAGSFLYAETLFNKKEYIEALTAYRKYVESYPSGSKSLEAVFQAAMCQEALGDKEKAARQLRDIWLKYPASSVASEAESNLLRLKAEKVTVEPYTAEEMFRRGTVFYDLQRYKDALETFLSIDVKELPESFKSRLTLKTGLTLFKSRRYKEAEPILTRLPANQDKEIACQASYWLARTLDRLGREDEAATWYARVAEAYSQSELAPYALYHIGLLDKERGDYIKANSTLEKIAATYPDSPLGPESLWEAAWNRYLAKDFRGAAISLTKLLDNPSYREKALYWLSKANEASGDKDSANSTVARLMEEYPYGFYALQLQPLKGTKICRLAAAGDKSPCPVPIPVGYERAKALITFGLIDEARTELKRYSKKSSGKSRLLDIARLYWEIPDYRSAMALFSKVDETNDQVWNFIYPKAFSEHVSQYAENYGVPESLAYSIIRAESNFHPSALSPAGAVGLMQIMPSTAKFLHKGKSGKIGASQLKQPELNIRLGMKHIQGLIRQYDGKLVFAVAAYNSGSTPVDRWRRSFPGLRDDEFIENIPYRETREYVKKVFASMAIYKSLYSLDAEKSSVQNSSQPSSAPDLALSSRDMKQAIGKDRPL